MKRSASTTTKKGDTLHSPAGCPFSNQFLLEAIINKVTTVSQIGPAFKTPPSFCTSFQTHDLLSSLGFAVFGFYIGFQGVIK